MIPMGAETLELTDNQVVIAGMEPLVEAVTDSAVDLIEGIRGDPRESRVLDVFADEVDGAVTEGKLRPAGVQAVKTLSLRLIAGANGHVQSTFAHALKRKDVGAPGVAAAGIPAAVPDAVPVAPGAGLRGRAGMIAVL